jgi:LysM repeat protein
MEENKMMKILDDSMMDQVSGGSVLPYTVKAQDTIESIAAENHCTVEQLMAWNHIKNPNMLTAGQVLKIKY